MDKPLAMASQSGSRPAGHETDHRERAEELRRRGWGYKRIGRELGVSRDRVRTWLRPRPACPGCGGPMSFSAKRCRACSVVPATPSTCLSVRLTPELADAFRAICQAEGRSISAAIGELVERRVAGGRP